MSDQNVQNPDGVGRVRGNKASYEWEISNFFEVFKKSEVSKSIESPKFKVLVHDQITEWRLNLYPKGIDEICSEFMSLYLTYVSDVDAYVKASFAIIHNEDMAVYIKSLSYKLFQEGITTGCPKFIEQNWLINRKKILIPEDKLRVRCEIFLAKSEEYYKKIEEGKVEDFEDFGMLFNNEKLSDVTISLTGQKRKLHVHKHVLAKKCKVFEAMFSHDMLESKNKSVDIEDVSYEAMQEMLRYIYTGEIFDITDSTFLDLIKAADKYQILDLKVRCENDIAKQLTTENALSVLVVAHQSNAVLLKEKTIEFIVANPKTVAENPEFDSLTQSHPEIFCEIFRKMAQKIA